jgi:hypothetical protein
VRVRVESSTGPSNQCQATVCLLAVALGFCLVIQGWLTCYVVPCTFQMSLSLIRLLAVYHRLRKLCKSPAQEIRWQQGPCNAGCQLATSKAEGILLSAA